MERKTHFTLSIILTVGLVMAGTCGYMFIEGWAFDDAFYMTIITLATVGYGEVHQISDLGRIFTIILIVSGVGYFMYVVGLIVQFLVEDRIRVILGRRKLDKRIAKLKNHYIICGYGRIGRVLSRYLTERYLNVVIIEKNKGRQATMNEDGVLYLLGEATDESLLIRAGIRSAKGMITAVATDADNVFLTLIARQLNPDLFIVARAIQNTAKRTLQAAGAAKVISPYDLGARRMAHAILRPTVIKFLELAFTDESTDIMMEEIRVRPTSRLLNVALKDSGIRQQLDLIILTIKKADNTLIFNPKADTRIETDDTLVVVGQAKSVNQLEQMMHN
ncbi:potassium transporter TrkA [Desulfosarcina alkanivorans]|uniref:Potassium transporter TrkA n=1 Tax=Desulfosarcina alkanivorans TaxID=571177 RepID=A0A5K7YH21_9BACT|nr:potassium channel protein [Desulfosarcina alkanivorans]BBO67129.1 potassium transporter TrkA [Desulfosarcina alkanivorans]